MKEEKFLPVTGSFSEEESERDRGNMREGKFLPVTGSFSEEERLMGVEVSVRTAVNLSLIPFMISTTVLMLNVGATTNSPLSSLNLSVYYIRIVLEELS